MKEHQSGPIRARSRQATDTLPRAARCRRTCLAVCLTLNVLAMACEHPSPPSSADLQKGAGEGLCLVQPDWNGIEVLNMNGAWGKHRLRVTPEGALFSEKRVAPDGSYVAGALEADLVGVALDGRLLWQLKAVSYSGKPAISPDAKKVALTLRDGRISVYDVLTARLDELPVRGQNSSWSSTGDRLAYDDGAQVHVYELARRTNFEVGRGTEPSWSPDGTSLAVRMDWEHVELVNVQTRARRVFLEASSPISVPRWSPNGEWMMYTRRGPRHWWSKAEWTGSEPSQILVRHVKSGTEASIGEFYKANPGDTWVVNRELCRASTAQ